MAGSLTYLPRRLARVEVLTREGWVTEEERRHVCLYTTEAFNLVCSQDDRPTRTQESDLSSNQSIFFFFFCG